MAQKWYQKAGVQAAIVTDSFLLVATVLTVFPRSQENILSNKAHTRDIEKWLRTPEPRGVQRNAFGAPAIDVSVIDYKHPSVDEFHFFGGPSCEISSQRKRIYGASFSASQTQCVYIDFGIAVHDSSHDIPVTLHKRFLYPDGRVLCDQDITSTIQIGNIRQSWFFGCSGRHDGSNWPTGMYAVEISIDGALLGRGHFEVQS